MFNKRMLRFVGLAIVVCATIFLVVIQDPFDEPVPIRIQLDGLDAECFCIMFVIEDRSGIHQAETYTQALGTGQWIRSRGDSISGCHVTCDGWIRTSCRLSKEFKRHGIVIRSCARNLSSIKDDPITAYWYSHDRFCDLAHQGKIATTDANSVERISLIQLRK